MSKSASDRMTKVALLWKAEAVEKRRKTDQYCRPFSLPKYPSAKTTKDEEVLNHFQQKGVRENNGGE